MHEIISKYKLGDMEVIYRKGRNLKGYDAVGMLLIPAGRTICAGKECDIEPLIQAKIVGDDYPFNYSQGRTMRFAETVTRMEYAGQRMEEDGDEIRIITVLEDPRGVCWEHIAVYHRGDRAIRIFCRVQNQREDTVTLEMFSSFTLGGLTPFEEGVAPETMDLYQIRSTWANEGRLVCCPIEEFQLEPSWKPSGANGIRFGQVGSMPNREYFPFIGIEDKKNHVCWGAQLAIGSSWQMEAYRKDDGLSISGGIADREKGHWMKRLKPGEWFDAPEAVLSVCGGSIDELCQRITGTVQNHLDIHPDEESLPVVFNEFCTTWGNPDGTLAEELADAAADLGAEYFVIDAGWYKKCANNDPRWSIEHGDWECSRQLFPEGMGKVVDHIHNRGMRAGIWFEPEDCGRASELFRREQLLCMRDGVPITAGHRRFLDMRKQEAVDYLDERVLHFLKENGFDYVKIDYNANLGIGPDGGDSPGEGLYESVLATQKYFRRLKERIPGLLIENCAAGGHRLTIPFLTISDMSSFSDAHESMNIPLVAANMHRMIPVRQSQIWAVLQPEFPDGLMYYKLSSTFLGRMCLSGDICNLSEHQKEIVRSAVSCYRKAAGIISDGVSRIRTGTGLSYKEPTGWQAVLRTSGDLTLAVIHTFAGCETKYELEVTDDQPVQILWTMKRDGIDLHIEKGVLKLTGLREFDGVVCCLRANTSR